MPVPELTSGPQDSQPHLARSSCGGELRPRNVSISDRRSRGRSRRRGLGFPLAVVPWSPLFTVIRSLVATSCRGVMELPYAKNLTSSEGRGIMVNTSVSARHSQLSEIPNQSSATGESSKRRKLKRETLLPCPKKRLKLKTRGEEGFTKCEEILEKSAGSEMKGEDAAVCHLPGIPLAPSNQNGKSGVIFVLEKASLVLAYVGRRYQILNPDEHADFLRKKKMDPYKYRPDIVYDALTRIMDSRLCMSGRVQAIYIKTDEGVLIKVDPHAKIPKTLEKFCAMIAQLLQKFSIKAKGRVGRQQKLLLDLVANPISQHLPVNSLKIGLSFSSQKAVRLEDYVSSVGDDVNLVFVVGAMAHGKIDNEHTDDFIAVSGYPLSAGECLRIICIAMDKKWKIW